MGGQPGGANNDVRPKVRDSPSSARSTTLAQLCSGASRSNKAVREVRRRPMWSHVEKTQETKTQGTKTQGTKRVVGLNSTSSVGLDSKHHRTVKVSDPGQDALRIKRSKMKARGHVESANAIQGRELRVLDAKTSDVGLRDEGRKAVRHVAACEQR
jgi:hypothetical protein